MTYLSSLFLDINELTGSIPPSIASQENLKLFTIANTSLAGDLTSLCNNSFKTDDEWVLWMADCHGDNP
eukprot:CAMPEP_0197450652 /NCGR_PEP_ID=MMETSP1175-20131217/26058_1 /TAXON_ID=1003142 /ORGANISM="Triceratium dubium, Strain CCMP147" /LENGTH=68 /DNA_ID=CAMNT_0042983117 /DNA_START=26 /DNA_END=229 /DNA_ORIENTATION=-